MLPMGDFPCNVKILNVFIVAYICRFWINSKILFSVIFPVFPRGPEGADVVFF